MAETRDFSDDDIVASVLKGDTNAYEALVLRYEQYISRVAVSYVPSDRVADISQTAFVKAFRSLKTYRGGDKFRQWLSGITVRCCYDFWREEKRRGEATESSLSSDCQNMLEMLAVDASTDQFLREVSQRDASELLDWALAQLSPEDRMVLTLTALEERSVGEAAELLGWTVVNVKVRSHRARKRLKNILEKA